MQEQQQFPNVTLVVNDGVPHIELRKSEDVTQKMLSGQSLHEVMQEVATKVNYSGGFDEIIELARQCDELFLHFPVRVDNNPEEITFPAVMSKVDQAVEEHEVLSHDSEDVVAQVELFWQGDVFASVLEELYTVLIADTVFTASQLGIGVIQLEENTGDARLRQKMAIELEKLEVPLILVS